MMGNCIENSRHGTSLLPQRKLWKRWLVFEAFPETRKENSIWETRN